MSAINIKEPTAARRRMLFIVYDLDGQPKTSLTFAGAQQQISKNGGAFANGAGSCTEIGLGWYYYTAAIAELDTVGSLVFVAPPQAGSPGTQQGDAITDVVVPDGMHNIPNSRLDNFVYNSNNMMTACRLRIFVDAAALDASVAGHADGADGEIERRTITGVDGGSGLPSTVAYKRTFP
jgi:hypothetical protein